MKKLLFTFLIFCFSVSLCLGQIHPVSLTLIQNNPLGPTFNHLSFASSDQIGVVLNLNDNSLIQLDVILEFEVKGPGFILKTNTSGLAFPLTLTYGFPQYFRSGEISDYFLSTSWIYSGNFNPFLYQQNLPEGYYEICVRVLDANHPHHPIISNASCINTFFNYENPPYLNLPLCNTSINPEFNSFIFQWSAVNNFSPLSEIKYHLEIWEYLPETYSLNQLILSSNPVFSVFTSDNFFEYSALEPNLVPGRKYIWRVKAIDQSGIILFRNNGFSVPCEFRYGDLPSSDNLFSLQLNVQSLNPHNARAQWNFVSVAQYYQLYLRRQNTSNWFLNTAIGNELMLYNLEAGISYEAKVRYVKGNDTSQFSNIVLFTTLDPNQVACNSEVTAVSLGEFPPLQSAHPGMMFSIGQFEMEVIEIQPASMNGRYTGKGRISVYNAVPLAVEFNSVYVDQNLIIQEGTVRALSNGIGNWANQNTVGNLSSGTESPETQIPYNVDTVIVNTNDGTITFIGDDGETTVISFDDEYGNTAEDSDGSLYVITNDGEVILVGISGNGSGAVSNSENVLFTEIGTGKFSALHNQLYGYDHFLNDELSNYYKTVRINIGGNQVCDWKSVQSSKYDKVDFNIEFLSNQYSIDSLVFITGTGTQYFPTQSGNKYTITFIGGSHGDAQELFAAIKTEQGIKFISKLYIVNYNLQIKKLHLVNYISSNNISAVQLTNELNENYKQAIIKWDVELHNESQPPINWDINNDGFLEVNSDLISRYSDELKIWNAELKSKSYYKKNDYYLIFPNFPCTENNLLGEMPRGKNIGFIFNTQGENSSTLAHELAHGTFGLKHIFSGSTAIPQGSTNNLMDYPVGVSILKFQWDLIQDPAALFGLSDADEEQRLYYDMFAGESFSVVNFNKSYLTPTGKAITIPGIVRARFNIFGGLVWFKLNNGKSYCGVYNATTDFFYGYLDVAEVHRIEGVLTDSKQRLLTTLLFQDFYYAAEADPVYAKGKLDLGEILTVCICDYEWLNNVVSNSIQEIPPRKIIPGYAERTNCIGHQCIDPSGMGIKNGAGKKLFIYNINKLPAGKSFDDFVVLCNWLSDTIQSNNFCFYGYNTEQYRGGDQLDIQHANIISEQGVFTIQDFHQKFPFVFSTCDYSLVFSTINLWSDVPEGYNRNQIDFVAKNRGVIKYYEYTFMDLVVRERLRSHPWFVAVNIMEAEGRAEALAQSGYFEQYVAKFGTNSAMPYIASCSAKWSKDILIAYAAGLAVPLIGASIPIIISYAGTLIAETITVTGVSSLAGLGEMLFFHVCRKLTYDAFIGAVVDFLLQAAIEYYFFADNNESFAQILPRIDFYSVGSSALENAFCSPLKRGPAVLLSSGISCIYDGFTEDGQIQDNFNYQDCAQGILSAIFANSISHFALKKLNTISFARFKIGMQKIGNFTEEKIDDFARWVGVKGIYLGTLVDSYVEVISKNENLPNWIKQSFRNSEYLTCRTKSQITLYRNFGGMAFLDGSFCTTVNNATRDELALHISFNNDMRFLSTIEVPQNTVINIGKVGPYPPGSINSLPGGADQILLPEGYNQNWIKQILDSQTGQIYTLDQFKLQFPSLVKNL